MGRRTAARFTKATAAVLVAALALVGCGDDGDDGTTSKGSVVIGTADFTEIAVVAEMYSQLLSNRGYDAETRTVPNRENYAPALIRGELDAVPDYLGTMTNYLYSEAQDDPDAVVATSDVDATLAELRSLAEDQDLVVLEVAPATSENAYAVSADFAAENDLTTLSDLGRADVSVVVAAPEECATRPLCGILLEDDYGIDVSDYRPFAFNSVPAKRQVERGDADMAVVSTLAADLDRFGLVVLEDDKQLMPAENLVPVLSADSPLADDKDAQDALDRLSGVLTSAELGTLIDRVDSDREQIADVARDFLQSNGLI